MKRPGNSCWLRWGKDQPEDIAEVPQRGHRPLPGRPGTSAWRGGTANVYLKIVRIIFAAAEADGFVVRVTRLGTSET